MVEDLHTAYWPEFEGGLHRDESFIEQCKGLIDELNADHSRGALAPTAFTGSTLSMHFYDSVVVFERGRHLRKHAPQIPTPSPLLWDSKLESRETGSRDRGRNRAGERIAPGKPQQNGRRQRMHLTLLRDAATPPAKSLREQFDLTACAPFNASTTRSVGTRNQLLRNIYQASQALRRGYARAWSCMVATRLRKPKARRRAKIGHSGFVFSVAWRPP
jgi:hypothetical protein